VERERWQGSPITRHGGLRPDYAPFYARFTRFLRELEFWRFRRFPSVLVVRNYDLDRYRAANSTLNYGNADLLRLPAALFEQEPDLGLSGIAEAVQWLDQLTSSLGAAGVDYDLSNTHLPLEHLRRYPLVCVQSAEFMAAEDQLRLLEYTQAGGRLIVGPMAPRLDEYLRPCALLGGVQTVEGPTEVVRAVPPPEYRADDPRLDVVVQRDGVRRLVFVANPTAERVNSHVMFTGEQHLRSVWGEPRTAKGDGSIAIELQPWTVQVWFREPVS
jgi:beta-galactosidase